MSRIIDLTQTLRPGMRGVEITPKCTVARDGSPCRAIAIEGIPPDGWLKGGVA